MLLVCRVAVIAILGRETFQDPKFRTLDEISFENAASAVLIVVGFEKNDVLEIHVSHIVRIVRKTRS